MHETRKTVLVVDDSPTVRAQVVECLSTQYECIEAGNGDEALKRVDDAPPDAVVADVEMPAMDGIALLRALKANPRTSAIPVVIITTVTNVEQVNQCRALGCAGFVLKPVQREYLVAKLRKLLP